MYFNLYFRNRGDLGWLSHGLIVTMFTYWQRRDIQLHSGKYLSTLPRARVFSMKVFTDELRSRLQKFRNRYTEVNFRK